MTAFEKKTIQHSVSYLGLGILPGEQSFFHENKGNYQERSHPSEKKNEGIEHVLKKLNDY